MRPASARADSKQSNQSWLNELLIISRTRQSGEGNCPYNGGAKYARPTVCKCGEGTAVGDGDGGRLRESGDVIR